ncbi:MAG: hypothetical protein DRQ78_08480 [Epsilonproteobacteria bacterium]|nr:MAG: hypothetical protein DRQ78_08480 [Campylobacterota bacterium]
MNSKEERLDASDDEDYDYDDTDSNPDNDSGVSSANRGPTLSNVQLFTKKGTRTRVALASENKNLNCKVLIVEMLFLDPQTAENPDHVARGFDKKRFWVALPTGTTGEQYDVNYRTAVPMLRNLSSKSSVYNSVVATGTTIRMEVPSGEFSQKSDKKKSYQDLKKEGKLAMSDVLFVEDSGMVPCLTHDYSTKFKNPHMDYDKVRDMYKGNYQRLSYQPTVNSIAGFGVMKPDVKLSDFYAKSGIKNGIIPLGTRDDSAKRHGYYFTGHVFSVVRGSTPVPMSWQLEDNVYSSDEKDSYSHKVHNRILQDQDNEFMFTGKLRVQEFSGNSGVAFRVIADSMTFLNHQESSQSGKEIDEDSFDEFLDGVDDDIDQSGSDEDLKAQKKAEKKAKKQAKKAKKLKEAEELKEATAKLEEEKAKADAFDEHMEAMVKEKMAKMSAEELKVLATKATTMAEVEPEAELAEEVRDDLKEISDEEFDALTEEEQALYIEKS